MQEAKIRPRGIPRCEFREHLRACQTIQIYSTLHYGLTDVKIACMLIDS
jgi:hypothetical protein